MAQGCGGLGLPPHGAGRRGDEEFSASQFDQCRLGRGVGIGDHRGCRETFRAAGDRGRDGRLQCAQAQRGEGDGDPYVRAAIDVPDRRTLGGADPGSTRAGEGDQLRVLDADLPCGWAVRRLIRHRH